MKTHDEIDRRRTAGLSRDELLDRIDALEAERMSERLTRERVELIRWHLQRGESVFPSVIEALCDMALAHLDATNEQPRYSYQRAVAYAEKMGLPTQFHEGGASVDAQAATAVIDHAAAHVRMVLVPREPTDAMTTAGFSALADEDGDQHTGEQIVSTTYRAMLAAAPSPDAPADRNSVLEEAIRAVNDAGGDNAEYHADAIRALKARDER